MINLTFVDVFLTNIPSLIRITPLSKFSSRKSIMISEMEIETRVSVISLLLNNQHLIWSMFLVCYVPYQHIRYLY